MILGFAGFPVCQLETSPYQIPQTNCLLSKLEDGRSQTPLTCPIIPCGSGQTFCPSQGKLSFIAARIYGRSLRLMQSCSVSAGGDWNCNRMEDQLRLR